MDNHGDDYGDIADFGENGIGTLLDKHSSEALYSTDSNQYIVVSLDGFIDYEIDAIDDQSAIEQFTVS